MEEIRQISAIELKRRLDAGDQITLIDVRESSEKEIADIGGELMPVGRILEFVESIPRDHDVVVYCHFGGRSSAAIDALSSHHQFSNLINLAGGIGAWSKDVDSSVSEY